MAQEFPFETLREAPLIVDAVYKGGRNNNMSDEVLSKLLPRTENSGGFRKTKVRGSSDRLAYITIYTTMSEPEWPDYFDVETGLFRYYGDNRMPGHELHDTRKKGNAMLRDLFAWLNDPESRHLIPPILVFKREVGRDVRFLGLAVPGGRNLGANEELVSFWRTMGSERFQNYEAYFTILDTGDEEISKEWLVSRVEGDADCDDRAPKVWRRFISRGRDGIEPLMSPRIIECPSKRDQLPQDPEGEAMVDAIRRRYRDFPQEFEPCAVRIVQMMDGNFQRFDVTRPWRDGGRDAVGWYTIGTERGSISIECSLEAKLYDADNGVGVREMSRLISRIRYRQFGIFVTTSYIGSQAYLEVKEDGHPIVLVTAREIVDILRSKQVDSTNIESWLDGISNETLMDVH